LRGDYLRKRPLKKLITGLASGPAIAHFTTLTYKRGAPLTALLSAVAKENAGAARLGSNWGAPQRNDLP